MAVAAGISVCRARRTGPFTHDGAGREREPWPGCLDAAEARGTGSGMAGGWRLWPVKSRGRMPARDHPAGLDADRRPGPRNVVAGSAGAVQAAGVQAGAAARDVPALPDVTLSDMEGRENAHTPAVRERLHDRSARGLRQSWAICARDAGCQHPVMPMKGRRDMRILRGSVGCTCWAGRTGGEVEWQSHPAT